MQCEYVNPREWNHSPRYEIKGCSYKAIYWVIYTPRGTDPPSYVRRSATRLNVCTRHKNRFVQNQEGRSSFRYGPLNKEGAD